MKRNSSFVVIHFAAVTDSDNQNVQLGSLNLANDAVVARPVAPKSEFAVPQRFADERGSSAQLARSIVHL
jgi:hypothetical protein